MKRTGFASLPLHYGKAPPWLFQRMTKLAKGIISIIIDEYGHDVLLRRISDPYWFQALGCALGYDWHSSGVTTVLTGVLKSVADPAELGIAVCGGKGKASMRTPDEILRVGDIMGLPTQKLLQLQYASRMSAKVDNTAVQAGYPLYHHAFLITEQGKWAVIQQGMSIRDRTARRYHWLSENLEDYIVEPHNAIVGDVQRDRVLDMTAKESEESRRISVDVIKEGPHRVCDLLQSVRPRYQLSLKEWTPELPASSVKADVSEYLAMPRRINWKALSAAYEYRPSNYEELLRIPGVGPSTVRGLALISELIYGEKPSWKDPVKYSFAYGGKDGVPYPVDRRAMDQSIHILEEAISHAKLGDKDRLGSLRRLRRFIPSDSRT